MNFILAVQSFKKTKKKHIKDRATDIFEKYIATNAPEQVNLRYKLRNSVEMYFEGDGLDMYQDEEIWDIFDDCVEQVKIVCGWLCC